MKEFRDLTLEEKMVLAAKAVGRTYPEFNPVDNGGDSHILQAELDLTVGFVWVKDGVPANITSVCGPGIIAPLWNQCREPFTPTDKEEKIDCIRRAIVNGAALIQLMKEEK